MFIPLSRAEPSRPVAVACRANFICCGNTLHNYELKMIKIHPRKYFYRCPALGHTDIVILPDANLNAATVKLENLLS